MRVMIDTSMSTTPAARRASSSTSLPWWDGRLTLPMLGTKVDRLCHRSKVMTEVVSDVGLVQRTEKRCTMHDGRWHDGMVDGGGWWFLMLIMMIAFWGGLIWLGITLVRHNHHAPPTTSPAAVSTTQPIIRP